MDKDKSETIIVHIIAPDGMDYYPRFISLTAACNFVEMMRQNKTPSSILNPDYL